MSTNGVATLKHGNRLLPSRLSARIAVGFAVVLLLTGALALFVVGTQNSLKDTFTDYRGLARGSNAAGDLIANTIRARLNVKEFILRGEAGNAERVRELLSTIDQLEADFTARVDDPVLEAQVRDAAADLRVYRDWFEQTVVHEYEAQEIAARLDAIGPSVRRDLTAVIEAAEQHGNLGLAIAAGRGQEHLMLARLYALIYRQNQTQESIDRVHLEASQAIEILTEAMRVDADRPETRAALAAIIEQFSDYEAAFERLVAVKQVRNAIVLDELDVIGPRVMQTLYDTRSAIVEAQDIYGPQAQRRFTSSLWTVGTTAVVTLILGAVIAFALGRMISRPLSGLSGAMGQIAQGRLDTDIEGTERADEIGDMARALAVFRTNAQERARLAEEKAAEDRKGAERAERVNTLIRVFETDVGASLNSVSTAADGLDGTAKDMAGAAEQSTSRTSAVAAAAEQSAQSVQSVASAAEELEASVNSISEQMSLSQQISADAVQTANGAQSSVESLVEQVQGISKVVELITSIAEQTNLLALNATIEAARAGEAGKGFAVVAAEVKNLANQTAQATDQIADQISGIQDLTGAAAGDMGEVRGIVDRLNEIADTVAAAVEEQSAATREIARNVQEAAAGSAEMTQNLGQVSQAASMTGTAAEQVLAASADLSRSSGDLRGRVEGFLADIRAA